MNEDEKLLRFIEDSGMSTEELNSDAVKMSCLMTDYVCASDYVDGESTSDEIHVVFCVPKKRYKGSNVMTNRMVDQAKSQWLRENAEKIWTHALESQCGIVAKEPEESEWRLDEVEDPRLIAARQAKLEQEQVVRDKELELSLLKSMDADFREKRRELRKTHDEGLAISVKSYDEKLASLKNDLKTERKMLTAAKNELKKLEKKASARHSTSERKAYIKAKMKLNDDNRLFQGPVEMMVRTNVITDHIFDAPNSWPSIKPIQDGGTDTCVLWADDNNEYIKSTTFYGGWKASRDFYVMEIIVRPLEDDFVDPFGEKIHLRDVASKNVEKAKRPSRKKSRR